MSRSYARFLETVTEALNALQPATHRPRSRAELALALERRNALVVETPRGPLKFHGGRGRTAFLMAHGLLTEEPETIAWIETHIRPDEHLWDVGAAIGAYAMYAARGGVRVTAFEPKATSYGLLNEHLALNGLGAAVTALPVAFSDTTAATALRLGEIAAGAAGNTLAGSTNQFGTIPAGFAQGALALTMDDAVTVFGLALPDHLKIDVDGLEPRILAGGPKVLRAVKTVLIEVEGQNAAGAPHLIEAPLKAAGLKEDTSYRAAGSARNRMFLRSE